MAMKLSTSILLGIVLTACGDDGPGVSDTGSSTGGSTSAADSTTGSSGSESAEGSSTTEAADTTDGEIPPDPTPILEREPMVTHACEEVRPMTAPVAEAYGRFEALVTLGGEYFVLRSSGPLALTSIALDGTLGDEVVLDPEEFTFRGATSVAVDASIVTVWTSNESTLRYAAVDDTLATVVAPKDVTGIAGAYVTAAALVPSASGGVALIYGESDVGGQTSLRFVPLDASGEPEAAPVEIDEVGQVYGYASASAAATGDGGYAVSYVVGDTWQTEVFFVILDADGTPRFEPRRISREAADGWRTELSGASRHSVLPVGDHYWVVFTEGWFDPDPRVMEGNSVVGLAIVDEQGGSESHRLQAPVDGRNNLWPSFVEFEDRVGVMWTSGTIIWICGGCIADNDLHFVLLDPDAVVPASNVVTQLHPQVNGITAPLGEFVGADMLTASTLDFHALTLPATGALRCEAAG